LEKIEKKSVLKIQQESVSEKNGRSTREQELKSRIKKRTKKIDRE